NLYVWFNIIFIYSFFFLILFFFSTLIYFKNFFTVFIFIYVKFWRLKIKKIVRCFYFIIFSRNKKYGIIYYII
ncbi:hypothetical protein H8356DRAFT_1742962, partial [Neocallimastix lanati (nom. inval.)]